MSVSGLCCLLMKIEVFADSDSVARQAAALIAAEARAAVAVRDRFVMAVSGGHTPWIMLKALSQEDIPWDKIHIAQVDERVAPAGHPDRNLTHLRESLLEHSPLPPSQIYAMPVESPDLESAARQYMQHSRVWLDPRQYSISSTWVLGQTDIPLRWCRETRFWRLATTVSV
jgi:6-phosphogluconolactonase/glucosamine-6-phosphate isomerase/deaminase